jgi:hypothetical protein
MGQREYKVPGPSYLRLTGRYARLGELEDAAADAVMAAARELGRALGHPPDNFWVETLPQALYALLDRFDPQASTAAAKGWLRTQLQLGEHELP